QDLRTEPEAEGEDFNAERFGEQKVPELVDEDERTDEDDEVNRAPVLRRAAERSTGRDARFVGRLPTEPTWTPASRASPSSSITSSPTTQSRSSWACSVRRARRERRCS